ncbi:hypothetical protein A3C59_05435 [Candidatus Daviesbacteria bacterium RIFCSPHIGHO2_02_FULL_36_13]|uniref:DUF4446 domain-containing protein n=1 Tax=Candidatus Daviesbacteria bacterium RIFCSPHIGHO2_02_FULL_36_13 TaxID=1797768 RepID=A0A1F5JZG8_9BACT|nr:MAG: hypothetical protein A3C59_05435 [Candidatus Daviesbacteria bacterium RIFCSPHIGHO2_02_FULL_36_13]
MYSDWAGFLGLVFLIWLGVLSFLEFRQREFLKSLFPRSGERDIRKKFEELISEVGDFDKDLGSLKNRLSGVEKLQLKHIQRVELLRYNPYDETGGDQSFTLALLDDGGNGIVITSLHARSATRIFAKPVIGAKAAKHQFSEEERQAIEVAMKNT